MNTNMEGLNKSGTSQKDLCIAPGSSTPILLSLPLEIRKLIYDEFLTVSHDSQVQRLQDAVHIVVLHVCKQVQDEAWNHLISSNRWFNIIHRRQIKYSANYCWNGLCYLPNKIMPPKKIEQANTASTISILMHGPKSLYRPNTDSCGFDQTTFLYTKSGYHEFMSRLTSTLHDTWFTMDVEINASLQNNHGPIVTNFLLPLTFIHGGEKVIFRNLMDIQFFKRLSATMSRVIPTDHREPFIIVARYLERILALKEEGDHLHEQGQHGEAMAMYLRSRSTFGLCTSFILSYTDIHLQHPIVNTICSTGVDVCNSYALVANHVKGGIRHLDGTFHPRSIDHLERILCVVSEAFNFSGSSQQQRRKAYLQRAVVTGHLAEYLSVPRNAEYHSTQHKTNLDVEYPKNLSVLLALAREDFYYAWKLAVEPDDAEKAKKLGEAFCERHHLAGFADGPVPELVTLDFPIFGTWIGDRTSAAILLEPDTAMAMPQTVARVSSVVNVPEIQNMNEELGIPSKRVDGLVRLLKIGYEQNK